MKCDMNSDDIHDQCTAIVTAAWSNGCENKDQVIGYLSRQVFDLRDELARRNNHTRDRDALDWLDGYVESGFTVEFQKEDESVICMLNSGCDRGYIGESVRDVLIQATSENPYSLTN